MSPTSAGRTTSVLIVEDHGRVRESLQDWIREFIPDARVRAVDSGEAALHALAEHPAHLVLMDVGLPGMNGIEATRALNRSFPEAAVIVLSDEAAPEYRREALSAGAAAYLHKSHINDRLRRLLGCLLQAGGKV